MRIVSFEANCVNPSSPPASQLGVARGGEGSSRLHSNFVVARDKWGWTDQAMAGDGDHTFPDLCKSSLEIFTIFFRSPNISRAINTVTDCLEMSKFQASFWNVSLIFGNLSFKWRIIPCIFSPISRAWGRVRRDFFPRRVCGPISTDKLTDNFWTLDPALASRKISIRNWREILVWVGWSVRLRDWNSQQLFLILRPSHSPAAASQE